MTRTPINAVQVGPTVELGRVCAYETIRGKGAFTELVLSFNADVPPGSGVVFEVACGAETGALTPFLRVAQWGDAVPPANGETVTLGARVAIDELILSVPAERAVVRAVAFEDGGRVTIHRLDTILSHPAPGVSLLPSRGRAIEWPVPFIANDEHDPELRSRLCSPTSLNMLVNHWIPGTAHADVVDRIYSPRFDLFGVWPRAVQTAWTFGIPGTLKRFADWKDVRRHLETVGPLAVSITARPGEVRGMPYESDSGHLIVLAGLTENGDAIVIDPALREESEARRVYRAEDLSLVWLQRKRGTAYALTAPARAETRSGSPRSAVISHPE